MTCTMTYETQEEEEESFQAEQRGNNVEKLVSVGSTYYNRIDRQTDERRECCSFFGGLGQCAKPSLAFMREEDR